MINYTALYDPIKPWSKSIVSFAKNDLNLLVGIFISLYLLMMWLLSFNKGEGGTDIKQIDVKRNLPYYLFLLLASMLKFMHEFWWKEID